MIQAANNILYNDLANYYAAIAEDRNFFNECETLLNLCKANNNNSVSKVFELFAGPAYHSHIFSHHYKYKTLSIDSSLEMKKIACTQYKIKDDDYLVGNLPELLRKENNLGKFDLILIMRYSLGLISPKNLKDLLKTLPEFLSEKGIIVIELHKINLLINNFRSLNIKSREKYIPATQQTLTCAWPAGPIKWYEHSWKVKMPIKFEVENDNGKKDIYSLSSIEYIYHLNDIKKHINAKQYICSATKLKNFQDSNIIIVKRR